MAEPGSKALGATPLEKGIIVEGASSSALDYRRFAGLALFPRSFSDLGSTTQCPACQTALVTTTCRACDLDLTPLPVRS